MASNNAIGTGALILTANADKMVAGMDRAGKLATAKAADISAKVDRAGGSGGGFFSKLFGGALTGGVIGAGIGAGLAVVTGAARLAVAAFQELEQKATGFDRKALFGIRKSVESLKAVGLGVLQKVFTAAAPAIMNITNLAVKFFNTYLMPFVTGSIRLFEKLAFAVTELGGAFLDVMGDAIEKALGLTGSVVNLDDMFEGFTKLAVDGLRILTVAFGYLWDGIKAGTGIVSVVAGGIVKAFGLIGDVIAKAIGKLDELASAMPAGYRPEWIGKAAEAVKGLAAGADELGDGMIANGLQAIGKFGESADVINGVFDRLEGRLAKQKKAIDDLSVPAEVKLGGAFQKGSTEAYSIVAKYQTGNMLKEAVDKQQLKALNDQKDLLKQLINTVAGTQVIRAI